MRIRGLGVIEDAVLELSPGFTAVTGETGAGKTMVVSGLDLLFGGRAETTRIRPGADRAVIEGRVLIPAEGAVARRAAETGAAIDPAEPGADGGARAELLLARVVGGQGSGQNASVRSRAHLGGQAVPVSVLADLGEDLIAMHGQSAQQRLLQPARQRASLDRYAGDAVSRPLGEYRAAYQQYRDVAAQLGELTTQARERAQEADALRYGLAEFDKVEPVAGELEKLAAEAQRLGSAESLRAAAASAHEALLSSDDAAVGGDACSLVNAARRAVEQVRGDDAAIAPIAARLEELYWQLTETATDLAGYLAGIEADPVRLEVVNQRIADLEHLCRRHGPTLDDVLAWAEQAAGRLAELDGDDDRIETLTARRDELRARLADHAAEVSAARRAAAEKFAAAVTGELAELAMPHARIAVHVAQRELPASADTSSALPVPYPDSGAQRLVAFGPNGVDDVELRLASHPGAPFLPIAKGASGGELSRVMLAVEVVFAGADPVPTFVFDEVDAGVGGKAAVEVGRRLARLARTAQVIVVTHLPQVAAFADRQLLVRKESDGSITSSGVTVLDDAERRRELARMLSGLEDSELGQAHAEELLAAAHAERR
ncbi:DNA repair protein RecN [Actinocrinis puniceicyclus]|uniref:DNA repair protein RecN n=1 Tax=Actinocrinis puniceicyclus TaxID=977794 RepID=A0A8J7WQ00_9ACTN|nr:DNA repair protein RecN [Actinocrinis puniceicyclus]